MFAKSLEDVEIFAQGSLEECRYYLILAKDLEYGKADGLRAKLEEVSKMLTTYMHRIRMDAR